MEMTSYQIDSRLKNDSLSVGRLELCEVRLIDDCRWPWLLLIPMRDGLCEIFDLDGQEQQLLAAETSHASAVLKRITGSEKINTGALGNTVQQLHVHIIARQQDDAKWPGQVWGFGSAEPYDKEKASTLIKQLQRELNVDVF